MDNDADADVFAVDLRRPVRRLTRFLHWMGLWPDEGDTSLLHSIAYTVYAVAFQLILTVAYDAFKCINFLYITDLTIITRAMFICLTELSLAVKIFNFRYRMRELQAMDVSNGIDMRSAREARTMTDALTFLRRIIVWFLVTANTTGVFSYLSPVLVEEVMLPYPGWYPLDWEHSRRDYWLLWSYQVLGMFCQIQALVIIEVYFIYLMVVASAQLDVLGSRMEAIGTEGTTVYMEAELVDCIKAHVRVLKFVKQVETAGSVPYFVQFVLSGIVLCVAVFQIAILNPSEAIAEFVFYVGFVMTMLTQIFLPCYFGNEMTLKSAALTQAVYKSNWPGGSDAYRQMVLVYLEVLKKPRRLVVGNLFGLTLDSFLSVINRAYSMYAVVQSFAE